jgi:IS605 OrfB family transposase
MQLKTSKQFTYQTRFKISEDQDQLLSSSAKLLSQVERQLFKELYQNPQKPNLNELKATYLKKYQITARQFNSCRIKLEGKVRSYKSLLHENIQLLKLKITKLTKHIKGLKEPFKIHHKKRRLCALEKKLEKLQKDQEMGVVRLCFGTKKLFHQQFYLEKNGFSSHEEWKKTWQAARNCSFFLIGSKDETFGNQSCQLSKSGDSFILYLRLPNTFSQKTLKIENISFGYGKEKISQALEENEKRKSAEQSNKSFSSLGKAINYLFKKDEKGWRLFVTIEEDKPALKTKKELGAIGLDINANQIALAETDRFGNLVKKEVLALSTYGKNKNQAKAIIGDVVKKIIKIALLEQKPIVIEKLDFAKKKQALRETNAHVSRMLSSFSYSQIISAIETKAFKEGVEVYSINPAFTSVIGRIKFMFRYGLSNHVSAALVIARRLNYYSEKLPRYLEIIDSKHSKSAFFLPERNRKKHVWSAYKELIQKLKAADVLHLSTIIRSSRSLKLLCDSASFDILPGKLRYVNSLAELLG